MMADTARLPIVEQSHGSLAEPWLLRVDACVAEFTVRLCGLPVMRGWLPAVSGEFVVGDEPRLQFELDATGARAGWAVVADGPYLRASSYDKVMFKSTGVQSIRSHRTDAVASLDIYGELHVRDLVPEIVLRTRIVAADEESLLLHGIGGLKLADLSPVERGRPPRGRLDLLFAAEFRR